MLWFFLDWGHIRCCGCCRWRFRSYSESLFQTPKRNQKALPRMNTYARPAEGAEDQKPDQEPRPDQEPLTLALSRRERELIEVIGRATPT